MQVTFYGVRSSIPAPGLHTVRYGGDTVCILVEFDEGGRLVLDAGSGLRILGDRLLDSNEEIRLLLSHQHWDHILGFPFFKPAYQPKRKIRIYCDWPHDEAVPAILDQMRAPLFPATHEGLQADVRCIRLATGQSFEILPRIQVHCLELNHPNGGLAFRIEGDDRSLAFITDNELEAQGDAPTSYADWVEFARGSDLLIHDSTYRGAEIAQKRGWGHSTFEQTVQLGCDAGVGTVALFGHETDRSDEELDAIATDAVALAQGRCRVLVARQGMTFSV